MKSNVLLQSESRELLGRNISVMSKDGFVCITEVMEALTEKREKQGLAPKRLDDLMSTKGFQEKMYALVKRLNINNICTAVKIAVQKNDLCISKLTDLKKYHMAYRKGKGKDQKWFVDPYFFVMVALELDPDIYASVVIWLTDGLIKNRNMATEEQLNDITELEIAISSIIDGGFITNYNDLISYLGKEWKKRWGNPIMALK